MHSVNTTQNVSKRMKLAINAAIGKKSTSERKHGFLPPPIPLDRSITKTLNKDDYLTMKLQLIPNKSTSPVYKLNVPYFKDGTPKELISPLLFILMLVKHN